MEEKYSSVGKIIRMGQIYSTNRPYTLFIDLSFLSATGPFSDLRDFESRVLPLLNYIDVIITNIGMVEKNPDIFTGKSSPRFLIRLDWTNVLRGEEYPLLTHKFEYVPVASILNAVRVGADGVVVSHLLGYGDEIEANSFRNLNKVIRDSYNEGLPVFAHFCPFGPGISEERFDIAVEMGVSMEFEAGVDAIFVPEVKGQTYENIRKFCSIPLFVWIKDKGITVNALLESINCGIKGFVFGKDFFVNRKALDHLLKLVKEFDEQDFKK